MRISDKIKIKLWIKRFTYDELMIIQSYINDEVRKRKKNLLSRK